MILAAAKVGGIYANDKYPLDFLLENLKIQNNVIENAWKNEAKRLLFLGSSCIYPKFSKQPIKEEELLKSSLEKTNEWYALAKISGIKICQALRKQYGFDAISLMPTNLYGKGDNYHKDNSHVLPALLDRFHVHKLEHKDFVKCWGSGKPKRSSCMLMIWLKHVFLHWKIGIQIIYTPLLMNGEPLTWLNVGTGIDISIKKLAEMISKITSYEGEIIWDHDKPDGTFQKLLDVSKLNTLGWSSKISLKEGLKLTYEEYKNDFKKTI